MIRTSKISRPLVLITVLLVGTLMSTATYAAGLWGGQARGSGGGGHAGGSGFSGGGHVGGGRVGGPGFSGGRHVGGSWRGGNWNRSRNVGIYLGAPIGFRYGSYPYPYYGTSYYGAPYYYPPAPIYYPVTQPAPITYIERSDEPQIDTQEASNDSPQNAQASWWYYCVDAKAYYPYVNQCPGGWLRVAPQPAPDSDDQPSPDNSPAP
ncbi:MAG: hypothetical protein DID91_2727704798 [Candidatus Nitrotoga sp. MKT]|nr:MAG: hypothetical protein DID91_2727704798 [Candidatus Nitrotoga sp. MKT]